MAGQLVLPQRYYWLKWDSIHLTCLVLRITITKMLVNIFKLLENLAIIMNWQIKLILQIGWNILRKELLTNFLRVQKMLPEVGINPETQLQPYHLKILEFIREKGFIAHRDYAKLVDRAKATRALDIKKLIELGLISRKGKGKASYYVLKEK